MSTYEAASLPSLSKMITVATSCPGNPNNRCEGLGFKETVMNSVSSKMSSSTILIMTSNVSPATLAVGIISVDWENALTSEVKLVPTS